MLHVEAAARAALAAVDEDAGTTTLHVDARAAGLGSAAVAPLLAAVEAAAGGAPFDHLPYAEWRARVRAPGGAAESALAVLPPPRPGLRGLALGSGARPGLARAAGAAALKAAGGAAPYDEAVWRTVAERLTERR